MITGSAFSAATSFASATGPVVLPMAGPLPPACEVEKNTGSTWSKSRSSRMRCTRTDPTIPRQPTIPTLNIVNSLQSGDDGVAHFCGSHLAGPRRVDVCGAQALPQHLGHRALDPAGVLLVLERIT